MQSIYIGVVGYFYEYILKISSISYGDFLMLKKSKNLENQLGAGFPVSLGK